MQKALKAGWLGVSYSTGNSGLFPHTSIISQPPEGFHRVQKKRVPFSIGTLIRILKVGDDRILSRLKAGLPQLSSTIGAGVPIAPDNYRDGINFSVLSLHKLFQ